MTPVTDEERKLIKERFAHMSQGPLTDAEATTIVRTLKDSHRWNRFMRKEGSSR